MAIIHGDDGTLPRLEELSSRGTMVTMKHTSTTINNFTGISDLWTLINAQASRLADGTTSDQFLVIRELPTYTWRRLTGIDTLLGDTSG